MPKVKQERHHCKPTPLQDVERKKRKRRTPFPKFKPFLSTLPNKLVVTHILPFVTFSRALNILRLVSTSFNALVKSTFMYHVFRETNTSWKSLEIEHFHFAHLFYSEAEVCLHLAKVAFVRQDVGRLITKLVNFANTWDCYPMKPAYHHLLHTLICYTNYNSLRVIYMQPMYYQNMKPETYAIMKQSFAYIDVFTTYYFQNSDEVKTTLEFKQTYFPTIVKLIKTNPLHNYIMLISWAHQNSMKDRIHDLLFGNSGIESAYLKQHPCCHLFIHFYVHLQFMTRNRVDKTVLSPLEVFDQTIFKDRFYFILFFSYYMDSCFFRPHITTILSHPKEYLILLANTEYRRYSSFECLVHLFDMKDEETALFFVKRTMANIKYVHPSLRSDLKFIEAMIKQDDSMFDYLSSSQRDDKRILLFFKNSTYSGFLDHIANNYTTDVEFLRQVLERNPRLSQYIG